METMKIQKINAISIADAIKNISNADREKLEKYSFVDIEGAIAKYSQPIKAEDVMNVLQFYLLALLYNFTEDELKETTTVVELPEELVTHISFIRQQNLLFKKGNSAFSVKITPYRELVVQYDSKIDTKNITWYSNVLGLLSVNGIVRDKSYMDFWTQSEPVVS